MRKLFIGLLAGMTMAIATPASAVLNVLTCEPEWAALTTELGGDLVNVSSATTGAQDPHHVQARPSLLNLARNADLLVCTGAELEIGWLPLLQHKTGNPKIRDGAEGSFMASDAVVMQGVPTVVDRSQGDVHAMGNPHIQTDPNNITAVATELNQRLQKLDPQNAALYQQRYENFKQRWQSAIRRWEQQAAGLRGKHIVVYHDSWTYMNDWLGLVQVATLEPKPGIPPTTEYLGGLLQNMQQQPAAAIIYAAYQPYRPAHWLSEKTGISAVKLPFTVGGIEGVDTLFDLFDETIRRLTGAMK